MEDAHKPWWEGDPELQEILRRSREEFEQDLERHDPVGPDEPDLVVNDFLGGASWRELADARDDLAAAAPPLPNAGG